MTMPDPDDFSSYEEYQEAVEDYYALAEQRWEEQRDLELLEKYEGQ